MLIHFLHSSTELLILCPGKSLNKALPEFPERLAQLLERLGASRYIYQFQAHSKPVIFTTNSRSMLAHMNQMEYNIEYHASLAENKGDINYVEIEDIQSDALLSSGGSGKFETPREIFHRLVDAL
jgi:hypothetical protein